MSNCRYCEWKGGMWKCTHPNGMMASEFCNSEEISEETAMDNCIDYDEVK